MLKTSNTESNSAAVWKTTEDFKILHDKMMDYDHSCVVVVGLVKQKFNALYPFVKSSESSKVGSEEGSDEECEKVETSENELDDNKHDEIMESLKDVLAALDHASYSRLNAYSNIAATAHRFHGIDAHLQQQKHTQSRIARVTEKGSEDMVRMMGMIRDLGIAVSKQGESMDLMLRRQDQIENSLYAIEEVVGVSDELPEDEGDQWYDQRENQRHKQLKNQWDDLGGSAQRERLSP